MNEIIKVTTDGNGDLLVSGRELHEGLMVKTQYTKWIERKIEKYGFIENTDFALVSQKRPTNNPKNPFTEITDHALTIDTAKEMAMTENTQKGRDTRRYFIEIEKQHIKQQFAVPTTLADALRLAADEAEENERLQLENAEMKPKALFADAVRGSTNSCLVKDLSVLLKQNGVDIGQNRLFKYLRGNGYLGKGNGHYNKPTQRSLDQGLFEYREHFHTNGNGEVEIRFTPLVTGKGQTHFVNKFLNEVTLSDARLVE